MKRCEPSCNLGESGASRQTALERLRKNYKCLPAIRFDAKSHRRGGIGVQVEPQRGYSNERRDIRLHSDLLIRARSANAYEADKLGRPGKAQPTGWWQAGTIFYWRLVSSTTSKMAVLSRRCLLPCSGGRFRPVATLSVAATRNGHERG